MKTTINKINNQMLAIKASNNQIQKASATLDKIDDTFLVNLYLKLTPGNEELTLKAHDEFINIVKNLKGDPNKIIEEKNNDRIELSITTTHRQYTLTSFIKFLMSRYEINKTTAVIEAIKLTGMSRRAIFAGMEKEEKGEILPASTQNLIKYITLSFSHNNAMIEILRSECKILPFYLDNIDTLTTTEKERIRTNWEAINKYYSFEHNFKQTIVDIDYKLSLLLPCELELMYVTPANATEKSKIVEEIKELIKHIHD